MSGTKTHPHQKLVDRINKMDGESVQQNILYNLNLVERNLREIKGYIRLIACVTLVALVLGAMIGIWFIVNASKL